jgi:hypothetical protein
LNPTLRALLAISLFALKAEPQPPYAPPPSSAGIVKGISFSSGIPAGDKFRSRFHECDSKDTCDGKRLQHGCSRDQNRNTALLRLSGNVIFFDAKMGLDADGSPLSKTRSGTDQPETSLRYPLPGKPSVDSDKVPYIVVPGGGFAKALGIELGDIAAVVFKDRVVYSLVADEGPTCKLGEGSIELHEQLGHKVCVARSAAKECTKLRDVGLDRDVLYFIFAGSKSRIFSGLTPANVNERLSVEGPRLMDALKNTK